MGIPKDSSNLTATTACGSDWIATGNSTQHTTPLLLLDTLGSTRPIGKLLLGITGLPCIWIFGKWFSNVDIVSLETIRAIRLSRQQILGSLSMDDKPFNIIAIDIWIAGATKSKGAFVEDKAMI
jgi:hypothetical protein